jgi:hypothetical protein
MLGDQGLDQALLQSYAWDVWIEHVDAVAGWIVVVAVAVLVVLDQWKLL